MGGVDLQELMDKYHVDTIQLDQVIPGNELPVIATYFDSVKLYSAAMGLSAAEQHDVRTTFLQYDTQTAMVRCLRLWKQYRPSMATYRALMELLLKLNRTEVAAQVCQYLAQNVSTPFMSVYIELKSHAVSILDLFPFIMQITDYNIRGMKIFQVKMETHKQMPV